MRNKVLACFFVLMFSADVFALGEELLNEKDLYKSITISAEYQFMPKFEPVKPKENKLFEDIKVSAIEAIPFAVLYTFVGLFLYEVSDQGTWQPKMKSVEDYKQVYYIAAGSLAALNVFVNVFSFYGHDNKNGEKK